MTLWPQYAVLALYGAHLLCVSAMDGEPKTGNHSAGVSLVNAVLWNALLWAGGFWDPLIMGK